MKFILALQLITTWYWYNHFEKMIFACTLGNKISNFTYRNNRSMNETYNRNQTTCGVHNRVADYASYKAAIISLNIQLQSGTVHFAYQITYKCFSRNINRPQPILEQHFCKYLTSYIYEHFRSLWERQLLTFFVLIPRSRSHRWPECRSESTSRDIKLLWGHREPQQGCAVIEIVWSNY